MARMPPASTKVVQPGLRRRIVARDEHVQRLAGDLARDQGRSERGVERLHDRRSSWQQLLDLLGGRAIGWCDQAVEGLVERVGDVDDDLVAELPVVTLERLVHGRIGKGQDYDVGGDWITDGPGAGVANRTVEFIGEFRRLGCVRAEDLDVGAAGDQAGGDPAGHAARAKQGDVHG